MDAKHLKAKCGGSSKMSIGEVSGLADEQGRIKARDAEGNLIYLKAAAEEPPKKPEKPDRQQDVSPKRRRRRRRRRDNNV